MMTTHTAIIFNIQKFSIHDGPGIRTVVFFKGCPLRCLWCSNPESQVLHTQILWDRRKCIHCHLCEKVCPVNCIHFNNIAEKETFTYQQDGCTGCLNCQQQCPKKALEYVGKLMSVDEVMKEVMKDYDFYEESGGGVTLSGGEVLVQHGFAYKLLEALKIRGIHRALETTGFAADEVFRKVSGQSSLLLYDMKHYDRDKHIRFTGVSNDQIISNMEWAVKEGIPIIARIPVIPGVNDSLEDAAGFSLLLRGVGVRKVQLLPFHQFGEGKYDGLGVEYQMKDVKALHVEDLLGYKGVMEEGGVEVTL